MQIDHLTSAQVIRYSEQLLELYRHCFANPPWNESAAQIQSYAQVLRVHLAQPGMSAVMAHDQSMLLGIAYGWPAPHQLPDDPFHQAISAQLPDTARHQVVAPAVVVAELMVHPQHRGRGIGRILLDEYVRNQPGAWLCTHPDAPACALYDSANWTPITRFTNHRGDPRVLYTWTAHRGQGTVLHGTRLRFKRSRLSRSAP